MQRLVHIKRRETKVKEERGTPIGDRRIGYWITPHSILSVLILYSNSWHYCLGVANEPSFKVTLEFHLWRYQLRRLLLLLTSHCSNSGHSFFFENLSPSALS